MPTDLDEVVDTSSLSPSDVVQPAPANIENVMPRTGSRFFFDLETIPDTSRQEYFNLDPVPEVPDEVPFDLLPDVADLILKPVDQIAKVMKMNPAPAWIDALEAAEKAGKARSTALKAIESGRDLVNASADVIAKNLKTMATTPEYCQIAAMSWAVDDDQVSSLVTQENPNGPWCDERELLELFWMMASQGRIIGFNIVAFDLPVIFCRSIILGVDASRTIDRSPRSKDIIDLHLVRGKWSSNLKAVAALMGIENPYPGAEGSQVAEWMADPETRENVRRYAASDVVLTREIYRKYRGFWF